MMSDRPPRRRTGVQVEARDRRLAAVHEAGHLVMARYLGCRDASARIFPNEDADEHQKRWTGQTSYGARWFSRLSRIRRQMIAVAGVVAEETWRRQEIDPVYWWDEDIMSPTDWAAAECTPGQLDGSGARAIERATDLFSRDGGSLWPALVCESSALLRFWK
jgi:hypothetical protein